MHDWGFWGGGFMPFFGIGPLLFFVVVIAAIWLLMRGRTSDERRESREPRDTPRQILERRYAAGEITKEQFEQMKRDLTS